MAAVALAVGGLFEGAEHERCIRLAAVPAPRRLARSPGGSPRPPPPPPAAAPAPGAAAGSARRGRAAARSAARPAAGRAGRGPGRPPAPACAPSSCATCSLARIISRSIRRCDSVCATARAPTTSPAASKRNSGSKDSTSRLVVPRRSPSAAAASRATASGSATPAGRLRLTGEDDVELVVVEPRVGADAAAVEARRARLRRPAPSSISAVTARRSTPGARLQASSLKRPRQHRLDRPGRVGAVGRAAAPRGRAASRARTWAATSAMWIQRRRPSPRAAPRRRRRSRAPWPGRR